MHCMIDIETLSTDNDATIVSIGAVKFNPNWFSNGEDQGNSEADGLASGGVLLRCGIEKQAGAADRRIHAALVVAAGQRSARRADGNASTSAVVLPRRLSVWAKAATASGRTA